MHVMEQSLWQVDSWSYTPYIEKKKKSQRVDNRRFLVRFVTARPAPWLLRSCHSSMSSQTAVAIWMAKLTLLTLQTCWHLTHVFKVCKVLQGQPSDHAFWCLLLESAKSMLAFHLCLTWTCSMRQNCMQNCTLCMRCIHMHNVSWSRSHGTSYGVWSEAQQKPACSMAATHSWACVAAVLEAWLHSTKWDETTCFVKMWHLLGRSLAWGIQLAMACCSWSDSLFTRSTPVTQALICRVTSSAESGCSVPLACNSSRNSRYDKDWVSLWCFACKSASQPSLLSQSLSALEAVISITEEVCNWHETIWGTMLNNLLF